MAENPYVAGDAANASNQKQQPGFWITGCAVFGIAVLLVILLLPAVRSARPAARRSSCGNNLKQIALAILNYEAAYHALPPAYTVDAEGKPLHSWRTLILPFMEGPRVYETIDLSKPWDDPANAKAFNSVIPTYRCPEAVGPANQTTYLAVVAPDGCFRLTEPRRLSEIKDGQSKTLMVIEAPLDQAVHWMSPNDADEQLVLGFGPASKLPHSGGTQAAFVDGSVHFLPAELPPAQRRALISIAGHDNVGEDYE